MYHHERNAPHTLTLHSAGAIYHLVRCADCCLGPPGPGVSGACSLQRPKHLCEKRLSHQSFELGERLPVWHRLTCSNRCLSSTPVDRNTSAPDGGNLCCRRDCRLLRDGSLVPAGKLVRSRSASVAAFNTLAGQA